MAKAVVAVEKIKAFWHSQFHDEENWAFNVKMVRAAGLFVGSIIFMRSCSDMMAAPQ